MANVITVIHGSNPLVAELKVLLPGTRQGADPSPRWVCSIGHEEVMRFVPEDSEFTYSPVVLEWVITGTEEDQKQKLPAVDWTDQEVVYEMPLDMYNAFKKADAGVFAMFDEPEVEVVEPRYKGTSLDNLLSVEEFARDLITKPEWFAIEEAAKVDSTVGMARDITLAGPVYVGHEDFLTFMALGVAKGIWSQERADEISLGLLIK